MQLILNEGWCLPAFYFDPIVFENGSLKSTALWHKSINLTELHLSCPA